MSNGGGVSRNFNKLLSEALDEAKRRENRELGGNFHRDLFWLKDSNGKSTEPPEKPGCDLCKGRAFSAEPFLVTIQRGNQVEAVFNYCPVCGRKL